jgi:protein tyrosine/serine phosphatase
VQRRIDLEGCYNFRDLGGYPTQDGARVRWRLLFRSDALNHLSPADVSRIVGEFAIGEIVDLRSSGELRSEGRGLLAEEAARFHHLPLFDSEVNEDAQHPAEYTLADRYFLMAEYAREPIARVIGTLADSTAPAVYHCAAGKDRTGVISAILLSLLGVCDELIIADYAASQEKLDDIIDRLLASEGYQGMLEALPPETLHAEPETMASLLERIRARYGSMHGYARGIGLSDESIRRLRERLLERD